MKICVTGGSGFIGTNMLLALKKRYAEAEIMGLDIRTPVYPVNGIAYRMIDVRDKKAITASLQGSDMIFHLAALIGTHESFEDSRAVFGTNIDGTLNVLDFARQVGAKVFVAGMPGIWNNPYSISKDAGVRLVLAYNEAYGVRACSLRWFSVYGPYQYVARYNKAIPTFIHRALNNASIPVYGDGEQIADYIYVEDAVNAAIDMLENKQWGKVYECATGVGISVNDLVAEIITMCRSTSRREYLPMRKGEPTGARVIANIHPLRAALPSFKARGLREGLQQTIAHYMTHPALD